MKDYSLSGIDIILYMQHNYIKTAAYNYFIHSFTNGCFSYVQDLYEDLTSLELFYTFTNTVFKLYIYLYAHAHTHKYVQHNHIDITKVF